MVIPPNWDQVQTLTEGLVMIAGWESGQDETGFTAKRSVVKAPDYEVDFVVSETPEFLEFTVRLTVISNRDIVEGRFDASINLLTRLWLEESLPQQLKMAGGEPRSLIYEFVYVWKCDAMLQQMITWDYLHRMIIKWSFDLSMPAVSFAPLLALYLRGIYRRDEDFVIELKKSLAMIAIPVEGRA